LWRMQFRRLPISGGIGNSAMLTLWIACSGNGLDLP
jgi:hypothetical protein